jgi:predicted LPLAT superfamily acyltransferase
MPQKKRGNKLGFLLFDFYLSMGIKHAYALLYFVSLHYLLFDRQTVKTISKYVKIRFKNAGILKRIQHIYRLIVFTGKNLIDLRQLERKPEKVNFECDNEPIKKIISRKKGLIIMTAHIGNWQVMMRKLPDFGAKINIVMQPEENQAVSDFLKLDHGKPYDLNIIDPEKGMETVLEIMQELSKGNIISIMGDRTINEKQTINLKLFSSDITLPKGPFLIANSAKAPIMMLLTNRKGPCSYVLETTELTIEDSIKGKEARINALAEQYIKSIENFLTRNPYEWNATSMN